jgi:hypothetical protein
VQEFEKAHANGEPVGEVLAITCPLCTTILGHWSTHLSATMSTKSRWIINKVRELLNELENETKVVVISSCPPNLTWFSRAFTGLQIPHTLCPNYDGDTDDTIANFMADLMNRVLLITPRAIQLEIVLPPSSHVIIGEAVVWDVKNYVFTNIRTVEPNRLFKTILIAEKTIEEEIINEPHFNDDYNSYDEHHSFVGPQFIPHTDLERVASLVERAFVIDEDEFLAGFPSDEDEDEDEDGEGGGGGEDQG